MNALRERLWWRFWLPVLLVCVCGVLYALEHGGIVPGVYVFMVIALPTTIGLLVARPSKGE